MSYLESPGGIPDFSKAVISLWFRVPQESVDLILASDAVPPVLPLITFGQPQIQKSYFGAFADVAVYHGSFIPPLPKFFGVPAVSVDSEEVVHSYIGLTATSDTGTPALRIEFDIRMKDYATLINAAIDRVQVDIQLAPIGTVDFSEGSGFFGVAVAADVPPGTTVSYAYSTLVDRSFTQNNAPEVFLVQPPLPLDADHWHHLLLSFDLSGSMSVGHPYPAGGCKLWYAIDDVDYRGAENLLPYRTPALGDDPGDGLDPNAIVTRNIYFFSGRSNEVRLTTDNQRIDDPSGHYTPGPVPAADADLGIPATTRWRDLNYIFPVELAELQIFTGMPLDTGDVDNRRAFISADGTPVSPLPPMIDNPDYNPALPEGPDNPLQIPDPDGSPAEKLLGKKPDILLHGSGNWIAGKNTAGPMIENPDYDPDLPAGPNNPALIPDPDFQFKPTGKIVSYSPDPSLHGPQSPPAPETGEMRRRRRMMASLAD